ncbi:putative receptor-like protein kinase At3g47110 [Eucalyptus grandis]|uniref:putative receptor-like protein kinase At3g47110 n=1 Tax=Eucalyptus grandis TaxID=71139 RepID=UPI00192F0E33|nr:putative receptor-like protein kinase At3g47110 [Eucalyptus grandis]
MDLAYRYQPLPMSFSCLTTILLLLGSVLALVKDGWDEIDRLALLEFKARIADPSGVLRSWNDSSHFCDWDGVTCGRKHRRVTILDLGSKNLYGVVPPHIGNLSFLRGVHLENNSFHAKIPPHFGLLFRLQKLFLNNNSFSGQIPSNLSYCSNLLILNLGINMLEGNLPTELGSLSKLQRLILQVNSNNQLEGGLPSDLGFTLPNIEIISTSQNHLTGPIPESISNASNLKEIQITENNLTGKVPSFSRIRGLYWFNIDDNNLGGEQSTDLDFLCSLTNSTKLNVLRIGVNAFRGPIPDCISNLSITLSIFGLAYSYIYGTLPYGIGSLINLEILEMQGNNISGNIPSEIGNLNKLKLLDLSQNKLSGQIPKSFGNFRMLIELCLDNNNLRGSIPSALKYCQNLLLLNLSTNSLSGYVPPEIMGLSSLSIYLDLSRNSLTGSLPEEVGKLQNLGELHLDRNRFSQQIPSSIGFECFQQPIVLPNPEISRVTKSTNLSLSYNDFEGALPTGGVFKSALSTSVIGNKKLCGGLPDFQLPKCYCKESKRTRISGIAKILISTVSALVGVACILSLLYFFWFRHNKNASASSSSEDGFLRVSYHNLLKATGGFSSTNLLGVGSFGSVYRGLLDQTQSVVAIKILNLTCDGASKSFIAECEVLRRIRHRNLVKVLTACSGFDFNGNDFKALVYEFMSNGSLDEWLHPTASQYMERNMLSLLERVNIAIDVACALDYLHHHCEMPIVHCDLKPSNVLLDDEMNGHVGDFGLAKFLPEATHKLLVDQSSSVGVKGSFGYVAPEYGAGSAVSTEGDVYSFGVLVLEMFTGKRPIDDMFENGLDLHRFTKAALADRVEKAIDPILLQEIEELEKRRTIAPEGKNKSWCSIKDCLVLIIEVGITCSFESSKERMDICNALTKLQEMRKKLLEFIVTV